MYSSESYTICQHLALRLLGHRQQSNLRALCRKLPSLGGDLPPPNLPTGSYAIEDGDASDTAVSVERNEPERHRVLISATQTEVAATVAVDFESARLRVDAEAVRNDEKRPTR